MWICIRYIKLHAEKSATIVERGDGERWKNFPNFPGRRYIFPKISREGGTYFPKFPGHKYLESYSEKSSSIINGRVRLFDEIN